MNFQKKNWLNVLLLTSLLAGCSTLGLNQVEYPDSFCQLYKPMGLIECNKEKLPEGSKCSEVVSKVTQQKWGVNENTYKKKCGG